MGHPRPRLIVQRVEGEAEGITTPRVPDDVRRELVARVRDGHAQSCPTRGTQYCSRDETAVRLLACLEIKCV